MSRRVLNKVPCDSLSLPDRVPLGELDRGNHVATTGDILFPDIHPNEILLGCELGKKLNTNWLLLH